MILRRISTAIRRQDWVTVTIEFVLIIAGVLIALQANNWNEDRVERNREALILQEIAADLKADLDDYQFSIEAILDKVATASYIIENTPPSPINQFKGFDSFVAEQDSAQVFTTQIQDARQRVLAKAGNFADRVERLRSRLWETAVLFSNASPSMTAFDSLVSSGELGIIQDENLVRRMQAYQKIVDSLETGQKFTFRPARDDAIRTGQKYGLSPFGGVDEATLLALVADKLELNAVLTTQIGWASGQLGLLASAAETATEILNEIEQELDKEVSQ